MNLPIKKVIRIDASKINESDVTYKNYLLKIIVEGTNAEIKAAMKNPKVRTWKDSGYKVAFKEKMGDNIGENKKIVVVKLSYPQVLKNRIRGNPLLLDAYNEIFSEK